MCLHFFRLLRTMQRGSTNAAVPNNNNNNNNAAVNNNNNNNNNTSHDPVDAAGTPITINENNIPTMPDIDETINLPTGATTFTMVDDNGNDDNNKIPETLIYPTGTTAASVKINGDDDGDDDDDDDDENKNDKSVPEMINRNKNTAAAAATTTIPETMNPAGAIAAAIVDDDDDNSNNKNIIAPVPLDPVDANRHGANAAIAIHKNNADDCNDRDRKQVPNVTVDTVAIVEAIQTGFKTLSKEMQDMNSNMKDMNSNMNKMGTRLEALEKALRDGPPVANSVTGLPRAEHSEDTASSSISTKTGSLKGAYSTTASAGVRSPLKSTRDEDSRKPSEVVVSVHNLNPHCEGVETTGMITGQTQTALARRLESWRAAAGDGSSSSVAYANVDNFRNLIPTEQADEGEEQSVAKDFHES